MGTQLEVLEQDFREVERRLNEMRGVGSGQVTALGAVSPIDFRPPPADPARPSADQQLRDGDLSHSTGSWWEAVVAVNDEFRECAHWYSNDAPIAGQVLSFIDARTSSVNKTLKTPAHSQYDAHYCDWSVPAGYARMTGTKSLDALLPASPVVPGRTEYFGSIIARRNSTIVIKESTRIAAMLYDNDAHDFMKSGVLFHLSGGTRGNPAGTTQRKYKVLAKTDRGYEFLSDELDLTDAPDDVSFGPNVDVGLSWPRIDGVLAYEVYRHDITAGKFRLLKTVTSGANTYGDNNRIDRDDVGSYPPASDDRVKCYVATVTGELSNLVVDGIGADWRTLFLNIPVPSTLASAASGNQVFRLALTEAMDRQMVDAISSAGSPTVESATAEFTALDTGRSATLKDADGNILHGPDSITFVDATHVNFSTNVATNNADATLYIVEGGDHGLLIDLLHLSYIERAKFGYYPEDRTRTLQPTAVPNVLSQGGLGPGGDTGDPGDGGLGGCITLDCPTWIYEGNWARAIPFSFLKRGCAMPSGNLSPNYSQDLLISETDNLHIVRFENRIEVPCSPGQCFFMSHVDFRGTAARCLKRGDFAITMRDGRLERSRVVEVIATGKTARVGSPALTPGHSYFAGYLRLPWYERFWRWLWPKDRGISAALLHNVKNRDGDIT